MSCYYCKENIDHAHDLYIEVCTGCASKLEETVPSASHNKAITKLPSLEECISNLKNIWDNLHLTCGEVQATEICHEFIERQLSQ